MKRIAELRKEKGLTQDDIAKKLFIKRETVAQWEVGSRDIKTAYIAPLAEIFGVTTDYLLEVTDNRTAANAEIGKITGLSDRSIAALFTYDGSKINLINDIIVLICEGKY